MDNDNTCDGGDNNRAGIYLAGLVYEVKDGTG